MDQAQAFEFLDRMARELAEMFGPSCETIVHDFSVPDHPILSIYNNHISGREIGSTKDLTGMQKEVGYDGDVVNLLAKTPDGRLVKSSTFRFCGDSFHLALGVNFDFTALSFAEQMLQEFTRTSTDFRSAVYHNVNVGKIFDSCASVIGKPTENLSKADRLRLISMLHKKGAFSYRKSVPYVAERLSVSRYTVYKYLDELGITPGEES